ncbi:MAG TPA: fumarate hydratase [Candidatus Aminicenantes bacterium]|nr:fumarate hydratase [Candidatus Aminicenantes bacterium]HRY65626.1 fumarate hydratase [Candidatus Aminicenantes bacterium]HRZ72486.1 fumarate hydratase [Candidatus Aminicenantes bacterium]
MNLIDPGPDKARYRKIAARGVGRTVCAGRPALRVAAGALEVLAREAFTDLAFFLRPGFLAAMRRILDDREAPANDRFVADAVLRNAVIAAEGVLPLCQDTGSIQVFAFRGHRVVTDGRDEDVLAAAASEVYRKRNLRYSIMAPLTVMDEVNTGTNLPAQIDLQAAAGPEYRFFFMAKGGGSSNKIALFQESKARLEDAALESFLAEKIRALGVAACPPYRVAVVVGGLSPEMTLKTVKLASAGFLDGLPRRGSKRGGAFRDAGWEERLMALARATGLGAQFGGKWLAHEARFVRLPRHAGSCPIGIGVSCNADRGLRGKITADGVFLEDVERRPSRFLEGARPAGPAAAVAVDLERPMEEILTKLRDLPVGTLVKLSGPVVVARDIAHARLARVLRDTGDVPEYFKRHPVYYAGPAKTPRGLPSGSFGPTTAQRMDGYLGEFMRAGASLVTLGKGNRTAAATEALKTFGGVFLGTIGGAAALIAREHIVSSETIDFADLGMEAVRRVVVRDLPAFVIYDGRGGDLYARAR